MKNFQVFNYAGEPENFKRLEDFNRKVNLFLSKHGVIDIKKDVKFQKGSQFLISYTIEYEN